MSVCKISDKCCKSRTAGRQKAVRDEKKCRVGCCDIAFLANFAAMMNTLPPDGAILALGANVDAPANMRRMQRMLSSRCADIVFTPVLTTPAIGIDAPPYANCLARLTWTGGYGALHTLTTQIEEAMGSTHAARHRGYVVADIDILLCDGRRYHEADWQRPYVAELLLML